MNVTNRQTHRQIDHATCDICRNTGISRIYAKASMHDAGQKYRVPNTGTDNDLKYRSHRALTWSYLPLPNGKACKVGQTVAQWWRSCWWKKPGVQAACTDRSRVPDTRRVPVRSRGSRTFVQIEAGGFYPRFYGICIETHSSELIRRVLYILCVVFRSLFCSSFIVCSRVCSFVWAS